MGTNKWGTDELLWFSTCLSQTAATKPNENKLGSLIFGTRMLILFDKSNSCLSIKQTNGETHKVLPGAHSEHSTLSVSLRSNQNHRPLTVPWGTPQHTLLWSSGSHTLWHFSSALPQSKMQNHHTSGGQTCDSQLAGMAGTYFIRTPSAATLCGVHS